jgi:Zn-dependent peptidase ImmA (M78 family)
MDRLAESVLLKAGLSSTWQGMAIKTDIDALIEFEFGLEIVWENIDHFSKDDVVLAAIIPKHKRIYMNETKQALFKEKMGTMNFSKAHELGHWILHVVKRQDFEQMSFAESETYFCRGTSKRPPEEIQADMFAASIFMPKDIIIGAVNSLKENGTVTFPDLYKLKNQFEVSITALASRYNS